MEDEPPYRRDKARGLGSWTPRKKRPDNLNSRPVGQVRTQVDVEPQDLRYCNAGLPPHGEAGFSERGYVDILGAATEGSSTMNGGDFGALPRIADDHGECASCLQSLSGSLFGN